MQFEFDENNNEVIPETDHQSSLFDLEENKQPDEQYCLELEDDFDETPAEKREKLLTAIEEIRSDLNPNDPLAKYLDTVEIKEDISDVANEDNGDMSKGEKTCKEARKETPLINIALRTVIAPFLGLIVFFAIAILLGVLLAIVAALLMQTGIGKIAIHYITSPIRYGWNVSEITALNASLGIPAYILAFNVASMVIKKIGKNNYLPFLIVGIILMIIYVPSGIKRFLAMEAFWADIYGILAAVAYIKEALELYKNPNIKGL